MMEKQDLPIAIGTPAECVRIELAKTLRGMELGDLTPKEREEFKRCWKNA